MTARKPVEQSATASWSIEAGSARHDGADVLWQRLKRSEMRGLGPTRHGFLIGRVAAPNWLLDAPAFMSCCVCEASSVCCKMHVYSLSFGVGPRQMRSAYQSILARTLACAKPGC